MLWLVTGGRQGEIAQQRALAEAIGLPFRELRVATLAAAGGIADIDTRELQPPWPRAVVSFGKTLPAAMEVRRRSGGATRVVQIGRPRHVDWSGIDLILPQPQDVVEPAPNVMFTRMPFNQPRNVRLDAVERRLLAGGLPRPWTLLAIGGVTRQYRFGARDVRALCDTACDRARRRGGSLLVTTSPRTPAHAADAAHRALSVPHEFYRYRAGDPENPLGTYTSLADEILLSGDSPSMVAECWRSAKPVLVQMPTYHWRYWLRRTWRRLLPRRAVESGRYPAALDINRWLVALEAEGLIGILGRSEPTRTYDRDLDDDLERVARRVRQLIDAR